MELKQDNQFDGYLFFSFLQSTDMDPQRGKEVLGEKQKESVIINTILN